MLNIINLNRLFGYKVISESFVLISIMGTVFNYNNIMYVLVIWKIHIFVAKIYITDEFNDFLIDIFGKCKKSMR